MARERPLTEGLPEKAYLDALARNMRLWRRKSIDAVMNRFRLDAIIEQAAKHRPLTFPATADLAAR